MVEWFLCNVIFISSGKYGTFIYVHFVPYWKVCFSFWSMRRWRRRKFTIEIRPRQVFGYHPPDGVFS